MWKYVARRIKDTVERTKNVIDVRLTWATAGNGNGSPDGQFTETSPQCIIKNYSLWSHLPPGHDNRKRFCGSNKKQDKRDDDEPDYGFQRKVWEALFWVNNCERIQLKSGTFLNFFAFNFHQLDTNPYFHLSTYSLRLQSEAVQAREQNRVPFYSSAIG